MQPAGRKEPWAEAYLALCPHLGSSAGPLKWRAAEKRREEGLGGCLGCIPQFKGDAWDDPQGHTVLMHSIHGA